VYPAEADRRWLAEEKKHTWRPQAQAQGRHLRGSALQTHRRGVDHFSPPRAITRETLRIIDLSSAYSLFGLWQKQHHTFQSSMHRTHGQPIK
jgi:hypothetical protein